PTNYLRKRVEIASAGSIVRKQAETLRLVVKSTLVNTCLMGLTGNEANDLLDARLRRIEFVGQR
ncbi:MAG TPA: hypothetical protein VNZ22_21705, partial [Bacillota bacterium]|nr:hypothetical protein [Bacillota bacterium]